MSPKLIWSVILTEYRRFFGEPTFYLLSLLRPYLWTLLLSEGIRHSINGGRQLSFLGLLSYCIVFTGITSSFSLCWERHYGFLRLWFVYGVNNLNYITGKLIFSCSLCIMVIITSLPLCLIIGNTPDAWRLIRVLPDIIIAIILIASIGLMVSSLVTRLDLFGVIINFILFPILFTSGAIFNIPSNSFVTFISRINPFRWALEPIKQSFYTDFSENEYLFFSRIAIIVFSSLCLYLATRFLRNDY